MCTIGPPRPSTGPPSGAPAGGRAALVAWSVSSVGLVAIVVSAVIATAGVATGYPAELGDWLVATLALLLAARVVSHVPGNPTGWLLLAAGACAAATVVLSVVPGPAASWARLWVWLPATGLLGLVLFFFPDGRSPSARWWPVAALIGGGTLLATVALASVTWRDPEAILQATAVEPGWDVWAGRIGLAALVVGFVSALAVPVVRIRRAAPDDRGLLLWAAAAAVLYLTGWMLGVAGVSQAGVLAALAVPSVTVVSVVRYGLYDMDRILHRSVVTGLLTLVVIALYTAAVTLAIEIAPAVTPAVAPVAAAVVVVLVVLPLHDRLRRVVDRWLFGQRSQPYELVRDLARGVGAALTPSEVLDSVVRGVGEGLKVPYVAVRLGEHEEQVFGRRRAWPVTVLGLEYRGEHIGDVVVQQRAPDEPWSARERRLLADLAEQVAPSAAAVRLTRDLQSARERLVTTREEERRRLRADLHDGVGPALSGARMQARACLGRDLAPEVSSRLTALSDDLALASDEIRRVIDGLRPPVLDRGLAEALRSSVRRYDGIDRVQVSLDVTGVLTGLPAAVEVAAFRVLDEALSNAVRHGRPSSVAVQVSRSPGWLEVDVRDDGTWLDPTRPDGVGLTSMRERCEELGGWLRVRPTPDGTEVHAAFPLR